jgi:hypothetical protein
MNKRVKHSKIKNTGILFELLSRQITQDVISDGNKNKSISLLKKFFNEKTEIGKENQLYQVLIKTNYNSNAKSQRLIEAVLKSYNKINTKKLKNEKYNLIKSISESYKTEDLRLLSYQLMVDNFNTKYKSLSKEQKNLLKEYINNISNTNSLREFVDSEAKKISKILKSELPKIDDDITRIKLSEAVNQISKLSKGRIVKDKQVVSLMRYYELIKELKNVGTK